MPSAPSSRYQVLGHLARGGMGEILLARRIGPAGFEKLVVLKRPLDTTAGSQALVSALIDEARLLAQINHPNVCQVHDLEEADGQFFLALEYLEGLSLWLILAQVAEKQTSIDPRVVCGLFEQACEGLDAIHGLRGRDGAPLGVIHRDISPGNLFLTDGGTLKILDLGIAKSTDSEERTPFGRVKGKLAYISPEQARGKPIDSRSDLFSLGLTLYDMARGEKPARDRIGAMVVDELDMRGIPAPLATVIARAVTVEVAARYASAKDMAAALREAGAAFGGSCTRAELGEWLSREFAVELGNRRALRRAFTDHDAAQPATVVRTMVSRSMIATDARDAALATGLPERHTEQLSVPEAERLRPQNPQAPSTELIAMAVIPSAPSVPPPRRARVRRYAIAAVLAAAALVAMFVITGTGSPRVRPANESVASAGQGTRLTLKETASVPAPMPGNVADQAPARVDEPAVASAPAEPPTSTQPARPAVSKLRTSKHSPVKPVTPPAAKVVDGSLTVHSNPYAIIRVGSRNLGTTTLWRIPMKPGKYTVHATTSDGRTQDRAITIESGEETKLGLEWSGT